ncbi:MAG: hypothetical protein M3290_02315 [Actinomycetota bacterium]|nr:hypothetical protein [Actinomycetota bacterium]
MSSIAAVDRDSLILQVLIAIVSIAIVATVAVVLLENNRGGTLASAGGGVTSPAIHQAPWKARIFPAGALGGVSKKEKKAVHAQAGALTQTIERSMDALVLDPDSAKSVVAKTFSSAAAKRILASNFGAPQGAHDLQTTERRAHIGIQTSGAGAAAAKVRIAFHANVKGRLAHVDQAATLWLQRVHHRWQVIGFEVNQKPAKTNAHTKRGRRAKGGKH